MGKVYMMPAGGTFSVDPPCVVFLDAEGNQQIAKIANVSDVCDMTDETGFITVNGKRIEKDSIIAVYLDGLDFAEIPSYFCQGFISLVKLSGIPSGLTKIGNNFLKDCRAFNKPLLLPDNITDIGMEFLNRCFSFNSNLKLPNRLLNIDMGFMNHCISYNKQLTLPNGLKNIGGGFMGSCEGYNSPIVIPSGLQAVGGNFMSNCYEMISLVTVNANPAIFASYGYELATITDNCFSFRNGVKIGGTYKTQFKAKFPDSTANPPFRRLILA